MSFLHPYFLIALGAAALPVLFHLVRQAKVRTVPFPSLMLLEATPKEVVRRRRLKDLLLMAVRSALFALLALAFSRPFLPAGETPFAPAAGAESVVLLIDQSYSMRYGDLLDEARRLALERLSGAGNEYAVVAFSDEARQLTPLGDDLELHRRAVEQAVRPTSRPTDFARPLRLAGEILRDARHERRRVVLISDFQQSGWSSQFENWKLDPSIRFEAAAPRRAAPDNRYLQALEIRTRREGDRTVVRFDLRVGAEGEPGRREKPVTLTVDGRPVDRRAAPAGPLASLAFQQTVEREGVYQGELAVEADALPVDDRRYFTYRAADRPSVLVIDPGPRGAGSPGFFLERVFDLGAEAPYRFRRAGPDEIELNALRRHRLVFLAGLPALSPAQLRAVERYVELGGHVVVSAGEGADGGLLRALGVGRPGGTAEAPGGALVTRIEPRHPVFEVFPPGGTFHARFRRYARVEPDSGTAVLGSYDTGEPFLLERSLGRGAVLAYTSTFDTGWTDFPVDELFVPFVYQLARYAARRSEDRLLFTVGEPVPLEGRPGESWEVRAPGDRWYRAAVDAAGSAVFRETEEPGHYLAVNGSERRLFSVNVDPRESALAARDPEEVYVAVVGTDAAPSAAPLRTAAGLGADEVEDRQKLWRLILLATIALFALESLLAHRARPAARRAAAGSRWLPDLKTLRDRVGGRAARRSGRIAPKQEARRP